MSQSKQLELIRDKLRQEQLIDETQQVGRLIQQANIDHETRQAISARGAALIRAIRSEAKPSMMEQFLAQYGLSTKEGVALMCLAEALLRVPDEGTIDALIEDKIASGKWNDHLGRSDSSLINSATWALLMTGQLLTSNQQQSWTNTIRVMVRRMGEPVIRTAVGQAMKELGRQFVLGRNIEEATKRARTLESKGYTHSYDMLGEAARTADDAARYLKSYSTAIAKISSAAIHPSIRLNPGISVKLSALHPRYEFSQKARVMEELAPRLLELALQAKAGNIGLNIDAEESERLDLSLDLIEDVLSRPELEGWDGFGVVVQTYSKRASSVIDWLYGLASQLNRKIMVRLVKGAYWDTEIKRAQVMGLADFPVYSRKINTDVSYMACAKQLLGMRDRIYPQFATHNAHTVAAVIELAGKQEGYEFQRLHGMGESLHQAVVSKGLAQCRIYAPVGAHEDLLAYLVRRLLENGANSSFVNQIVDKRVSPESIAKDPFDSVLGLGQVSSELIPKPANLYGSVRANAKGWDLNDPLVIQALDEARSKFKQVQWQAEPIIVGKRSANDSLPVINPADPQDRVGSVIEADKADTDTAIVAAQAGFKSWSNVAVSERAKILKNVAVLFEENSVELFSIASREAGKNLLDAVAEVREAVDFAYYYASEVENAHSGRSARGVIVAISPWNFPLAIFTGQVVAALAAGNAVIAKPAEQTALMAARAVQLMHEAGVPRDALQLLPGRGDLVGAALTSDPRISGVCFTGSTDTAMLINRSMAQNFSPDAPLIAETGGLNVMMVDSTALPEQVVRDVLASAFQSAGQRCSALRMIYLQEDIAEGLLKMLFGAMDELKIGNPWFLDTDVGPVIDEESKAKIEQHCGKYEKAGALLKRLDVPKEGLFVSPAVIKVSGIEALSEEIFGPVLHVATFKASEIDKVVAAVNAKGYGLTFGLHTRVDSRVEQVCTQIKVGNTYVNRNQIGAIVGSQPFGGEGLSGTGPKAGGPHYVERFTAVPVMHIAEKASTTIELSEIQKSIDLLLKQPAKSLTELAQLLESRVTELATSLVSQPMLMPGPTGELNQLTCHPRGLILCLGPDEASMRSQVATALAQGNSVVAIADCADSALPEWFADHSLALTRLKGRIEPEYLRDLSGIAAVASNAEVETLRAYRIALAARPGAILPLITELDQPERYVIERHLCVDTTAAGGNASLIAVSE